jgi:hypothetical protein
VAAGYAPGVQLQWPQPQECAADALSPLIFAKLFGVGEAVAKSDSKRFTSFVPHAGQCTSTGFLSKTSSSKRFSHLQH